MAHGPQRGGSDGRLGLQGRGGPVWLVASRIILRAHPAALWIRALAFGGPISLALSAALLRSEVGGVFALGLFGVSAFATVIGWILLRLVPTIAVSSLGIAFGVAALFTVMAVTSGFEAELLRGTSRINGHLLVTKYGLDFFEYEDKAAQLLRRPEVIGVSPFAWGMVSLSRLGEDEAVAESASASAGELLEASGEPVVAAIKGIDPPQAMAFEGLSEIFEAGDPQRLAPGNLHIQAPTAAMGRRLAAKLGVKVGDSVRIVAPREIDGSEDPFAAGPRAATFEVVDLLDTGVADLDGQIVLVHLRAAQSLLFGEGRVTGIELQLDLPGEAASLAPQIQAALNISGRPVLYRAMDWAAGSTAIIVMRNIRQVVTLILSLIVLVAGSTLVGALLLIIRRRRKQIAMLATLGAKPWMVFWIFEAAGLFAGLLGAIGGLALGAACCWALQIFHWPLDPSVYPIDYLPVTARWMDGLIPSAVALVVCAVLSGPAAVAASRLPILASLRGR